MGLLADDYGLPLVNLLRSIFKCSRISIPLHQKRAIKESIGISFSFLIPWMNLPA